MIQNSADAAREYRAGIAAYESLPTSGSRVSDVRASLAEARRGWARTLASSGDTEAALTQIRLALEARRQIAAENPHDAAARQGLEHALQMHGDIYGDLPRKQTQAAESLSEALSIARSLVAEFPDQNTYRTDLASVLSSFGNNWQKANEPQRAYPFYRESLSLVRELAAADPADARSRRSVAIHSTNLALVLEIMGQSGEAERLYRESIVLQQRLMEQNPASRRHPYDLAFVRGALGRLLIKNGRAADGRQELHAASDLQNRLLEFDPENPDYRMRQSQVLKTLGDELRERREWALALAEYQRAAKLLRSRRGETVPGTNPDEIAARIAACQREIAGK